MGTKRADLNPPLGWYGGPCLVVNRIRRTLPAPAAAWLEDQVESGRELSNPEAAKVYKLEVEKGVGLFKVLRLTSHDQYRMDLRSITVNDIRIALRNFQRKLNDWKSQNSVEYRRFMADWTRGEAIKWVDQKLGDLVVVFSRHSDEEINIVTTYWEGLPDPEPETCPVRLAYSPPAGDLSGYRTMVKNPSPNRSDTGDGKYKEQALPSPPWKREKPTGDWGYNGPGESGSSGDGRSVHKDKARTQGTPGEQSPHPDTPARISPVRRPGLTADEAGSCIQANQSTSPFPGANRQKRQKGQAQAYFKQRYRRQRSQIVRRQKRRYKRLRNNPQFQYDRERRRLYPERFKRRPGGGVHTNAERARLDRKKRKASWEPMPFFHYPTSEWGWVTDVSPEGDVRYELADAENTLDLDTFLDQAVFEDADLEVFLRYLDEVFEYEPEPTEDEADEDIPDEAFDAWLKVGLTVHQRPVHRRQRQHGQDRRRSRMYYMKHRSQNRAKARKRYRQLRNNPQFKKQQAIRHKHPERFKMRRGDEQQAPEIGFLFLPSLEAGTVCGIESETGFIIFDLMADETGEVVRTGALPVDDFFDAVVFLSDEDIDEMFALLDTELVPDADSMEPEVVEDPVDALAMRVVADFLYKKAPPDMDPEQVRDRAHGHGPYWREPLPLFQYPAIEDSNPGSRVRPWDKGHVDKLAALIPDIQQTCGNDLRARAKAIRPKLSRVDQKNAVWLFNVEGSDGPYRVRLKAKRQGNILDMKKLHVLVSCSCPFWRWQGPEYWAKQGGYLYGQPQGLATKPEVKDPNGQHRACKHVLACFQWVLDHKWQAPRGKTAAFDRVVRFLVDNPHQVEMVAVFPEFEQSIERLATRYLQTWRSENA